MSGHGHDGADLHTLRGRVRAATGQSTYDCYQCGKCSAGCPLAGETDFPPSQILRLLQYGQPDTDEQVLRSLGIWLCLACETCATRCPQEVDIPRIMDYLRQESLRRGLVNPRAKDIRAFYEALLGSVEKNGRLHEVGLVSTYKFRTGHLFQDVGIAPRMLARGKLGLFPHKIEGRAAVERIVAKCKAKADTGETPGPQNAAAHKGEDHS